MTKSSKLEKYKKKEDNMIKDIRNLFRPIKEIVDTIIKGVRNLSRLKKENEAIQGGILRDIRNLSEHEEEDYCK